MAEKEKPKTEGGRLTEGQTKSNSKIVSVGPKQTPPPAKPPAPPKK